MNLVIFESKSTGKQERAFKPTLDDDMLVLWQGKDFKEFYEETGLSEAEIGGIVKQNGKLLFSIEKKAESEAFKKPIAKGKDLLNYLIKVVREQSNQEGLKPSRKCIKLNRFENIFTKWKYLDTETGNIWKYLEIEDEFTKAEFDDFVKSLIDSQALNNQNGKKIIVDSVIGLIQQWSSTVRFV
jgi:hypothetical protein